VGKIDGVGRQAMTGRGTPLGRGRSHKDRCWPPSRMSSREPVGLKVQLFSKWGSGPIAGGEGEDVGEVVGDVEERRRPVPRAGGSEKICAWWTEDCQVRFAGSIESEEFLPDWLAGVEACRSAEIVGAATTGAGWKRGFPKVICLGAIGRKCHCQRQKWTVTVGRESDSRKTRSEPEIIRTTRCAGRWIRQKKVDRSGGTRTGARDKLRAVHRRGEKPLRIS